MDKMFFWGCFLGIALCVAGWLSSQPSKYVFVERILLPEYVSAIKKYSALKDTSDTAFEIKNSKERTLTRLFKTAAGDEDFKSPHKQRLSKIVEWDITKIQLIKYVPYALLQDGSMTEQATFRVWDSNNINVTFATYDLANYLKQKYGDHFLIRFSGPLFWTGIGLLCLLLVVDRFSYYF